MSLRGGALRDYREDANLMLIVCFPKSEQNSDRNDMEN